MTPQELEDFFSRIDLNPERIEDSELPEGWRVARPSDFQFVRPADFSEREMGFTATFRVAGPWQTIDDRDDIRLIADMCLAPTGEWLLPDDSSTVIVFRPDEKAATQGPPKATRWPSWDKVCKTT